MKYVKCFSDLPNNALLCPTYGGKQDTGDDIDAQIDVVEEKLSITGCCFSKKERIDCQQWIKEYGYMQPLKYL
ncbi:MAG: hypothetical protein ACOY46_13775 [Bacillota bacterium]